MALREYNKSQLCRALQSAEQHAILWRDPPTTETRLPRMSNLACILVHHSPTKIVAVSFCSCRFAGVHCTQIVLHSTTLRLFELTAKSAVIIFMFVVCRSAYPIFCKPRAIHNTRSTDTWHCIYYKHLNAGMSWHS